MITVYNCHNCGGFHFEVSFVANTVIDTVEQAGASAQCRSCRHFHPTERADIRDLKNGFSRFLFFIRQWPF